MEYGGGHIYLSKHIYVIKTKDLFALVKDVADDLTE